MISADTLHIVDTLRVFNVTPNNPFSITTLINLALIVINIAIAVYLNFFVFNKRRSSERLYQMNFNLYKSLVIDKLEKLISHCSEVEKIIKEIFNTTKTGEDLIEYTQSKFVLMEEIQEKFYREDIPYITSYSKRMSVDLKNVTEIFYDNLTELLSNFASSKSVDDKSILMKFAIFKNSYYNHIFNMIRKYQPKNDE